LIGFSATAGAMIGNASHEDLDVVRRIGAKLGLLFQISDDLLDVTQPTEKLGKTAGKDADARKSTYPNLLGIDGTRKLLADVHDQTVAECRALSERSGLLESIAGFITSRES
jgi:geranylgeranyl diphosphate synthase type II